MDHFNSIQNSPRRKLDVAWLSLILSLWTFIYTFFPQFNQYNTNYIQRANSGDVDAQMFLAEHYFDVGDIQESHYWYKVAAMSYGDHQGTAINNVAVIGLTYKYYNEAVTDYPEKALRMFKEAICLGDETAVQNLYKLLISRKDQWIGIDYETELAWVIQVSDMYNFTLGGVSAADVAWAYDQFHIDPDRLYGSDTGLAFSLEIGIFPYGDPFSEHETNYASYEYHAAPASA